MLFHSFNPEIIMITNYISEIIMNIINYVTNLKEC